MNGYPGAVHLSLPVDIMFSSFDENAGRHERPYDLSAQPHYRAWPDPAQLSIVLEKLNSQNILFLLVDMVFGGLAPKVNLNRLDKR